MSYTKTRGSQVPDTTTGGIIAADDFNSHSAGDLTGKTAPLGGVWSEAGDAAGYTIDTANGRAQRTELSDADLNTGHYARLGSLTPSVVDLTSDVFIPFTLTNLVGTVRLGIFARYVDVDNWVMAVFVPDDYWFYYNFWGVYLYKRVAGTVTQLGAYPNYSFGDPYSPFPLRLTIDADGNYSVYSAYPATRRRWFFPAPTRTWPPAGRWRMAASVPMTHGLLRPHKLAGLTI